ncbi:MAG: CCA tRNA nucleotidyltransferase, partial [Alphaproteobacteria bacterium]
MATPDFITPALLELREHFRNDPEGFDIRLVGGCVRDYLRGQDHPKDIDLCTDANPEQQIAVYRRHGVKFITTGLQHGTITVKIGSELFEITSLRGETDHDGRHATVFYHRDWEADQSRRDLTINSIMMDLDGITYDPFHGEEDLKQGRVVFVGDPGERMREDYLRILRLVRFHGRFTKTLALDEDTADAVRLHAKGLEGISRERVWSEVSRIATGLYGGYMLYEMMRLGVSGPCGLPNGAWREVNMVEGMVQSPVAMMVAFLIDPKAVAKLAEDWKWSSAETRLGAFLSENLMQASDWRWLLAKDR